MLQIVRQATLRTWRTKASPGPSLALLVAGALSIGPGIARADVVIAVAAPLTGRFAPLGKETLLAVEMAAEDTNAAGGIKGQKVVIVAEDDGCDSARARDAATRLAEQRPAVVIGHPCAGAAIAAAPIYAERKLIFIAPGVRHTVLTDKRAGPGVFRLAGRDDRQGAAAAAALARAAPGGKIAIVQDRTAYARGILADTLKELAALGAPPPLVIPIVAGKRDYPDVVDQIAKAGSQATLFAGYPSEAALILSGLRKAGVSQVFIGSDSISGQVMTVPDAQSTTPEVFVLTPYSAALADVEPKLRARILAVAKDAGAPFTAAYAAAEVWRQAASSAATENFTNIATVISRATFETSALGEIRFDSRGDAMISSFASTPAVVARSRVTN